MSKYEWERGEIKLPSAVAATFRKEFAAYVNGRIDRAFELIQKAHERVMVEYKGKRNVDFRKALGIATGELFAQNTHLFGGLDADALDREFGYNINHIYFGNDPERVRPMKPTRVRFTVKLQPTKKMKYSDGEFTIALDGRWVCWRVSENNHAVENSHDHPVAAQFFGLLGEVPWTRGSGGEIFGNDEYNSDPENGSGAGGNYVTHSYGPQKKTSRYGY